MIPIAVSSCTPYDRTYESGKLWFYAFYSSGLRFDTENTEKVKHALGKYVHTISFLFIFKIVYDHNDCFSVIVFYVLCCG